MKKFDCPQPKLAATDRRQRKTNRLALLPVLAVALLAQGAFAARPGGVAVLLPPFVPVPAPQPYLPAVSPFDVTGFIQSATVDTPGDYFSAGWLEVNGLKIRIPRNTIFQMPATAMSWADMFLNAPPAFKLVGQSGLALSDNSCPGAVTPCRPLTTYEVHVQGNRVVNQITLADQYIAGLVYISQQAANIGQGIINAIDYSKCVPGTPCMPDIWVGNTLTARTGARFRLNTISGRYGAPDANLACLAGGPCVDKRFTADEDNPTIVARTGYPMCVPRFDPAIKNDSLCPQWNRPRDPFTGAFSVNYTFPVAPAGAPNALGDGLTHQVGYPTPAVTPDPFEQTPMEVGDTVTYVGNLVQDVTPCPAGAPASSCFYISAHTVTVELGLYTAPGTWPVYCFMSEFRIGVGGTPNPIFPQEAVEKVFGDFFTTDNTQLVDVYAVDVNSTTGVPSHRYYGSSDPFGPPLGGLKGRARFRVTIGNFLPPTRFMAVASRSYTKGAPVDNVLPTTQLIANGLKAGYFEAPQFEFIFPENLVLGSMQIPLTFQEFPFLANGSGPYVPWNAPLGTAAVGAVGQLAPWPSLNAPPALANSTGTALLQPPVINAMPAQTVPSGATVTLTANATDPNVPPLPLFYTWQQIAGPTVIMLSPDIQLPTQQFIAPTLAAGAPNVVLTFQLAVCNGFTCGGISSVSITVMAGGGNPAVSLSVSPSISVACTGVPVTLTATATQGTPPFSFKFTQTAGPVVPGFPVTNTTGTVTFTSPVCPAGTPTPINLAFQVTVTDAKALTASTSTTIYDGPDTITAPNVVYALSKSRLQVVATDSVPGGLAILTVTPLDLNGNPIAAGMVMSYDPTLNSYLTPLNWLVNPEPNSVRITSSLGGVLISPVTKTR
jgi:hypothetical protein